MRTILITGINGFIGNALAERFTKMGETVYGIDVRKKDACPYQTFTLDMVSESSTDILKKVQPDILIHCAGCADVNFSIKYPANDFLGNVSAFHKLLFDMKACDMRYPKVVFLSSAAVYGQPKELPVKETASLNPISPYALHKKMAEDVCLYFAHEHGFDIVIARIFSAYGPGLQKQIFWDMAQKLKSTGKLELFGTGEETRDFIFKDDLVEAIMLLATSRGSKYEIYNVANGKEIKIREIAELFLKHNAVKEGIVRFSQTVREGNPNNWCADISRIRELGYVQKVTIDQGIQEYVRWISDKT